jgi:membrane-bound serine protease (ClpP class)
MRLLAALVVLAASSPAWAKGQAVVLRVSGVINAGTLRYIERGLEIAKERQAEVAVIVLDTPGGLLDTTRKIVQRMSASPVPVAVWVAPSGASATSAGTIITMSAAFAAMAPGTNIGAAHPVGGQGEEIKGTMAEKATNDTVAFIKSQAAMHSRNTLWAELAIRKSVSATADEAAKSHVVDFLAADLHELLMKIAGRTANGRVMDSAGSPVEEVGMNATERFLEIIGHPNVSYLLMMLGGLGLYIEMTSPGVVVPGILGAISLILAFVSFSTLPINIGGLALLLLGLALFAAEAFVTSYGALTAGGIASLVLGALLLMDPSASDLKISLALVIPTAAALAAITATIGYLAFKTRRTVYAGLSNFEGFEGVVESFDATHGVGKLHIRGETWDFELSQPGQGVNTGDRVAVVDRKGFKLTVRKL